MKNPFAKIWQTLTNEQKLSVYAYLLLTFFFIGNFVKVPYKGEGYDIVLYLSFIVYGFCIFGCFRLFRESRKNGFWGTRPAIIMLICIGVVVMDIVYLATPQLTAEQKIEQIMNSQ